MSGNSDSGGEIIAILFIGTIVVMAVLAAIAVAMSVGSLWGAGQAAVNYGTAFRNNVRPEALS
ncbi:hypothetical protein SAMN02982917_3048 [Azospirillum oryzae]|uniref:Uncharacterized protein n=1 Tax=Azospirillum oryzae TaxID=286727 RepID=A0A1X7FND4_9PROT|nr:hypothetical protein [Azospirillum oryzae]SMF55158.1 hypothetical protein SAMN02982917_3048 [Azospirillum oryzae]